MVDAIAIDLGGLSILEACAQADENERALLAGKPGWLPAIRVVAEDGALLCMNWEEVPPVHGGRKELLVGHRALALDLARTTITAPPWVKGVWLMSRDARVRVKTSPERA